MMFQGPKGYIAHSNIYSILFDQTSVEYKKIDGSSTFYTFTLFPCICASMLFRNQNWNQKIVFIVVIYTTTTVKYIHFSVKVVEEVRMLMLVREKVKML